MYLSLFQTGNRWQINTRQSQSGNVRKKTVENVKEESMFVQIVNFFGGTTAKMRIIQIPAQFEVPFNANLPA